MGKSGMNVVGLGACCAAYATSHFTLHTSHFTLHAGQLALHRNDRMSAECQSGTAAHQGLFPAASTEQLATFLDRF